MGLLGTLLGGGLGFMFFGPVGAIIGGAMGSNMEMGSGSRGHPGARARGSGRSGFGPTTGYNPLQAQQVFLVAMISLAAKVAKADGAVTREEIASFDAFLQKNLGMPGEERRVAARIFNEARDSTIPTSEFARQIRQALGHQPQRMRDMISLLMIIAMADGHLHPAEESLIGEVARDLGLSDRDYQDVMAQFNSGASLQGAYTALGLDKGATDSEIKAAYRRLAKEYHPDMIANKGLGEDFQKFAAEKMRAVNGAYDSIKDARGF